VRRHQQRHDVLEERRERVGLEHDHRRVVAGEEDGASSAPGRTSATQTLPSPSAATGTPAGKSSSPPKPIAAPVKSSSTGAPAIPRAREGDTRSWSTVAASRSVTTG